MDDSNIKRLRELSDSLIPTHDDIARRAIELLADGILIVEAKGQIRYASEQTAGLFGYSNREILGMSVDDLVPSEYREAHEMQRMGFMAEGTTRRMADGDILHGICKDGSKVSIRIGLSKLTFGSRDAVLCVIQRVK